jgi:hypothetical protein
MRLYVSHIFKEKGNKNLGKPGKLRNVGTVCMGDSYGDKAPDTLRTKYDKEGEKRRN